MYCMQLAESVPSTAVPDSHELYIHFIGLKSHEHVTGGGGLHLLFTLSQTSISTPEVHRQNHALGTSINVLATIAR